MPRESKKNKRTRTREIIARLKEEYPHAEIALRYNDPFQLLIATILSAQCTDERVNQVTPSLFEKYPTPTDFQRAPIEAIEKEIYSTGFYRNKAKSIKGAADVIVNCYDGNVPGTMESLLKVPGVGRKTANVILGHCFDIPALVVDTHVKRISRLLKLTASHNPDVIERDLQQLIPEQDWVLFSHLLMSLGRSVCIARRPKCDECVLRNLCPSAT